MGFARHLAAATVAALLACSGGSSSSPPPPPPPECTTAADCGTAAHGAWACTGGACELAACDAGFDDCDADAANGCEAGLAADPANCGGCGNACPAPANATAACAASACGIGACDPGYADCDHDPADGCEVSVASDVANCGTCGNACAAGDSCVSGVCTAPCATPGAACSFDGGQVCDLDGACVPASVVVVQVGDGSAALGTGATQVYLRRFDIFGAEVGSPVALPTAVSGANRALTMSGSQTSEGALARSADFRYLTLAGYDAAPGTAAVAATTSAAVNRVIGRVDASWNVDTTTALSTPFSTSSVRGATTADGAGFWAFGRDSYVQYALLGAASSTQINTTPSNVRVCEIFAGQLYCDAAGASFPSVFTVGTGIPTTSGQTATLLPGLSAASGSSPYGFALLERSASVAGLDTLYVADDRTIGSGGGVQKWTFDGATWTLATTFTGGLQAGVRGLTAFVVNRSVTLVATEATASANRLVTAVDDGVNPPSFTPLATAPADTVFRGVAPMPNP